MPERIVSCQALPQEVCIDFLFGPHLAHSHLDWVGLERRVFNETSFALIENQTIKSMLTASTDQGTASWLSVFRALHDLNYPNNFSILYAHLKEILKSYGCNYLYSLCFSDWFKRLLVENGFSEVNQIVSLERGNSALPDVFQNGLETRPLIIRDIKALLDLDKRAFDAEWQLTDESLDAILDMPHFGLVAIKEGQLAGYALSTIHEDQSHLARLAVDTTQIGQKLGSALLSASILGQKALGIRHFTVNTQAKNAPSLHLYKQFGYFETGQRVPVLRAMLTG